MPIKSSSRPQTGHVCAGPDAKRFAHVLAVETVPDTGLDINIRANETERAALATQAGVPSVQFFEARFHVCKQTRGRFEVSGSLRARVVQTCVVSLEPFESEIAAQMDVAFAPPGGLAAEKFAAEGDPPDPIVDGQIDLGALAAEFLVLNLDLYPRKPGAVFAAAENCAKPDARDSPFAVLLRR